MFVRQEVVAASIASVLVLSLLHSFSCCLCLSLRHSVPKVINYQVDCLIQWQCTEDRLVQTTVSNLQCTTVRPAARNSGRRCPRNNNCKCKEWYFDYAIGSGDGGGDATLPNFEDDDSVYLSVEVGPSESVHVLPPTATFRGRLSPRKQIFFRNAINAVRSAAYASPVRQRCTGARACLRQPASWWYQSAGGCHRHKPSRKDSALASSGRVGIGTSTPYSKLALGRGRVRKTL